MKIYIVNRDKMLDKMDYSKQKEIHQALFKGFISFISKDGLIPLEINCMGFKFLYSHNLDSVYFYICKL